MTKKAPLWKHTYPSININLETVSMPYCFYCRTTLRQFEYTDFELESAYGRPDPLILSMCPCCGWWTVKQSYDEPWSGTRSDTRTYGAAGSLKELDILDINTPLETVKSYLVAKYESRFSLTPELFEHTVASVFHDFSFETLVTALTNDGGIDIVLMKDNKKVGVQVKRWKNSVKVGQIREFAGALLLGDYTRGVFVTTSEFQSGTRKAASQFELRGYPIELVDAKGFYDVLKIAQNKKFERPENIEPYVKNLEEVDYWQYKD